MKIFSRLAGASGASPLAFFAASVLLLACSQTPITVTLHSLQSSGKVSFVCQGDDGAGIGVGLKLDECPDYEDQHRRILALIGQTATNEVALVDLRAGNVVDLDPSTPGYSFIRVGAAPGAIVSSPGGVASFVGVSGLLKNGVFGLPTSCFEPPMAGQAARDLTSWSACALTSAPGDMTLLIDPPTLGDPTNPTPRAACGSTNPETSPDPAQQPSGDAGVAAPECPADLTREGGPRGRRKLLVALPEENKLVLLDAQSLLDRPPGEFNACAVEATYPLQTTLPSDAIISTLPDDLRGATDDPATCPVTQFPALKAAVATPAGMALSNNDLYVADHTLPVVHRLDVTDPCAPKENAPLVNRSYLDPKRVVTTSRVAVSPLTPSGEEYVYAVDENDQPASLMVFDVSADVRVGANVKSRAPLIFPGAPRQPYSPPDRLRFSAPVRDISFVMRDFPAPDPITGVGSFGVTCDPNPLSSITSPGAEYRPNSDFSSGARPVNLRGVFGFAMLTNGQIPIIDVEDFDAPCRRPIFPNSSSVEDFRGCLPDKDPPNQFGLGSSYFTIGETSTDTPTVSNESSCNIVEANRPRASELSISNSTVGLHAPTLRSLPQFTNPDPSAVLDPSEQPHLLAVDLPNPITGGLPIPAQVNVSGQPYSTTCTTRNDPAKTNSKLTEQPPCDNTVQPLQTDPTVAVSNSLSLPQVEPRSYAANEAPTLTFEGRVLPDRTSGILSPPTGTGPWVMQDPDAGFCAAGVEDTSAIAVEAGELGIAAANLSGWTAAHADYVQITGDFLISTDSYWSKGAGQHCGDLINGPANSIDGYDACNTEFGNIDDPTALKTTRELTVLSAFSDHLEVGPRNGNSVAAVHCCFPSGTSYTVRASHQWYLSSPASQHDIGAATSGRCVHTASCDQRKKFFRSRAFEVCDSDPQAPTGTAPEDLCAVGAANVGCVRSFSAVQKEDGAVAGALEPSGPGSEGSACIFENLTARFVVYRGSLPSTRDMVFTWGTTGGFTPLAMSLASQSTAVDPEAMAYLPELGYLAVVDGSSLGLSLFDLNSLGVVSPSPIF